MLTLWLLLRIGLPHPLHQSVFAVFPIALHNVSNQPDNPADPPAVLLLAQEMQARLTQCGFAVSAIDSAPPPTGDWPRGYYFDHPELAAAWAAPRHADWALVGRLNRVSPWVADLEMRIVATAEQRTLDTRIVELKGFGMNPDLTARLANRGAAWMVDQVLQSLAHVGADTAAAIRPCPA